MLLSRIVENNKFVLNGDPCQIGLAFGLSGLQEDTAYVFNRLRALTSFHFVKTTSYIPDNVGTRYKLTTADNCLPINNFIFPYKTTF